MTWAMTAPIEAGQMAVLELDGLAGRASHPARIALVEGDLIWAEAPAGYPLPVDPSSADPVVVHTWRLMDARYTLRTTLERVESVPRPLLGLRVDDVERVQDREYFRVPMSAQAQARAIGPDGEMWLFGIKVHDLSAAGLRATSQLALNVGDELCATLRLRDLTEPLTLHAQVVRVIEPPLGPDLSCLIGAAFRDLQPDTRERIIRFALQLQIEHRRRELGR